jgi:hypothetical protein
MSEQKITVPTRAGAKEQDGWIKNVSTYIDAGTDVKFVNELDEAINISKIHSMQIASIAFYGAGYTSAEEQTITIAPGVFHVIPGISTIVAARTDKLKTIHVKV